VLYAEQLGEGVDAEEALWGRARANGGLFFVLQLCVVWCGVWCEVCE
jgi:hypothetical protein